MRWRWRRRPAEEILWGCDPWLFERWALIRDRFTGEQLYWWWQTLNPFEREALRRRAGVEISYRTYAMSARRFQTLRVELRMDTMAIDDVLAQARAAVQEREERRHGTPGE